MFTAPGGSAYSQSVPTVVIRTHWLWGDHFLSQETNALKRHHRITVLLHHQRPDYEVNHSQCFKFTDISGRFPLWFVGNQKPEHEVAVHQDPLRPLLARCFGKSFVPVKQTGTVHLTQKRNILTNKNLKKHLVFAMETFVLLC